MIFDPDTRILAIDPGKTDGFATYQKGSGLLPSVNWVIEYDGPTYDGFLQCIIDYYPDVIVYEGFNHRQKDKVEYISSEKIGLIKWYAERRQLPLFEQSSSYGKGFFDNTKLKKLGLYIPGKPHGMDALRHMLQFLMKNDMFDLRMLK